VQPKASKNQIVGLHGDALKIRLTAPPVDNAANKMCIHFLADQLDVPKATLELIAGHTSRTKKVIIQSVGNDKTSSKKAIRQRLQTLLNS